MEKRSVKEWLIRIALLMIGLIIAHLGVTLFLLVDLGSDPFNVLIQGIFRRISASGTASFFTHGRVHVAISLLIILILIFADRSYIKIGTLLCMIFGGPIIDVFSLVLNPIIGKVTALPVRIIILALGCVIIGWLLGGTFGIGTIICAALVGPVAGFFMPFSEKICSKAVGATTLLT